MTTYILMFIEGLTSFASPCVLPLVPLFMSYLSSDAKIIDENGNITYKKLKVFLTTLSFSLGMSIIFLILAFSINYIAPVISSYTNIIGLIGGTIIIIFGLHQIGLINISILNKEVRFQTDIKFNSINYLKAFIFGFLFTFGWSPCVGPQLTSAITLAASAETNGYLYLIVYAIGFILPFILTGLFTGIILEFIKKYKNILQIIIKLAGVIMIIFGCYTIYNSANKIISLQNNSNSKEITTDDEYYLNNYSFYDATGNSIDLKNYQGKYVYLNFVATWCSYCKEGIDDYQTFSNKYKDEVVCLYVMSPEVNKEDATKIIDYINQNNVILPILIDNESLLMNELNIYSFPTLYVIGPNSRVLGFQPGSLKIEGFEDIHGKAVNLYNSKEN